MVRYQFEYFLTMLVGFFARLVPLKVAHLIGDLIGDFFFYVIRIRKKVAFNNLKQSFGLEKSDQELKKILHQNYRHFGRVLVEFARIPLFNSKTILQHIPISNVQYLGELTNQDKGIIVLSGHFGNWEYLAAALASMLKPLYCVFKAQKNLAIDDVIKRIRINAGLTPLKVKGGAAKGILKALQEQASVLLLLDQDAGRNGEFIDFLGRPASTSKGAALIAIKHKIPVIMAFGVREKDSLIRVYLEPFPEINQFPNNDQGVKQFLIQYNSILEKYIRKYPEQWFWMHRRWKTQKKE